MFGVRGKVDDVLGFYYRQNCGSFNITPQQNWYQTKRQLFAEYPGWNWTEKKAQNVTRHFQIPIPRSSSWDTQQIRLVFYKCLVYLYLQVKYFIRDTVRDAFLFINICWQITSLFRENKTFLVTIFNKYKTSKIIIRKRFEKFTKQSSPLMPSEIDFASSLGKRRTLP